MDVKIGDTVHYVSYGTPGGEYQSQCRAAVVTEVTGRAPADVNTYVSVCVLNPSGQFFDQNLPYSHGGTQGSRRGGTWHHRTECGR